MVSQLSMPSKGDMVAIMTTNRGVIKIKLFPEQAPKTVENFTTHAKNGYYEGEHYAVTWAFGHLFSAGKRKSLAKHGLQGFFLVHRIPSAQIAPRPWRSTM